MQGQGNTQASSLDDLSKDGDDVQTTVIDYGQAVVRRIRNNDLTILSVTGVYTAALGKDLERHCQECRTNLGLEFTNIKVNPASKKKFDSSIVGVLRNIRDSYRARKREVLLCQPPSELVDLLKLTGVYEGYQVIEKPAVAVLRSDFRQDRDEEIGARNTPPPQNTEALGRRILHLNQSLKRTASLEKGLDSAEKCVKRFLPQSPPTAEGYEFAFSYKSSEKIGGDFFDFVKTSPQHLGLLVGDVSGHGIDAAILMGITKKVIRLRAEGQPEPNPAQVLMQASRDLFSDFSSCSFVTALYGSLELATGRFTFARAGHEMPVTFGPRHEPTIVKANGMPIGPTFARNFDRCLEQAAVEVPQGGYLLLFTDGLPECWSSRGEIFGRPRLLFLLRQIKHEMSCQQALDTILRELTEFAGGRPQEDDMTAVLVKRIH